jgi:hypothetical protein
VISFPEQVNVFNAALIREHMLAVILEAVGGQSAHDARSGIPPSSR